MDFDNAIRAIVVEIANIEYTDLLWFCRFASTN
jgi:hypothetical protein